MDKDRSTQATAKKRAQIDWENIKRRLEAVGAAIEHTASADREETQRILKSRAQTLGRKPELAELNVERIEVVEFILAQEHYAVESQHVRDVYPLEQLTLVPCAPAFVLGIVNLHGEIMSVIDIKKFFDLPERGLTDLDKVIVLESDCMCFGILADVIVGVHTIREADIQPSLPTLTGIREEYLRGVTSNRTIILDAVALLEDQGIVVQEQVST